MVRKLDYNLECLMGGWQECCLADLKELSMETNLATQWEFLMVWTTESLMESKRAN
jgi:hypothetical protein